MNERSANGHSRGRFGPFEVDLSEGKLFKRGLAVRLENRPFQVLTALLEQPGKLVTREELQARLWPNGIHVDFEEGLNTAVKKLRSALGDSAETPIFIDTIPRRGYSFIAPVAWNASSGVEALPKQQVNPSDGPTGVADSTAQNTPRAQVVVSRKAVLSLGVIAIVSCLIPLLAWRHWRGSTTKEPEFLRLSFGRGSIMSARIAPDGQSVVYGAAWDGKPVQLYLARAGSPDILPLGISADILAISRAGQMAVLLRRRFGLVESTKGTLATMSLTGKAPKEILDEVSDADWSPDGSKLAVIHYLGDVCRLEYPIGHVVYQTSGGAWLSNLRISPDGSRIAFLEHPLTNDDTGHAAAIEVGGQNAKTVLSKDFYGIVGLAWKPSGRELLFGATEAGVGGGRALFKAGITTGATLVRRETGHLTIQDVASDGSLLLTRDIRGDEVFGHFSQREKDRPLGWQSICLPTALSEDGAWLLLSVQGELTGRGYEAYVRSVSGSDPILLGEGTPSEFSPDGKSVVTLYPWGIQPSATPQLRLVPVGLGDARQITNDFISHTWAGWFPDGKRLAFIGAEPGRRSRTWIQNIEGGKPDVITPEGIFGTKVSPDGKTLAAIDSNQMLWLYPTGGGVARSLVNLDPVEEVDRWSRDGKYLFTTRYGMPAEVYRVDARTGVRKLVHQAAPADPAGVLTVGPVLVTGDGQSYVYAYTRVLSTLYLVRGL
jgi:DNA-binding winged helix-turn-helix (wHTH) protein/Tol biopolymer transport system component